MKFRIIQNGPDSFIVEEKGCFAAWISSRLGTFGSQRRAEEAVRKEIEIRNFQSKVVKEIDA